MRSKFVLPLILVLAGTHTVHAQFAKDPAALMPQKALAYAEIRNIGTLAKEFGALFEGSALGNVPDSLEKIRSKYMDKLDAPSGRVGGMAASAFGILFAPEARAELGRLDGAAIALTGVDLERGEPKFLAVILPGQSNIPPFLMRMMLTTVPVRKVETVEGVTLYGFETKTMVKKPMKQGDTKMEWETKVTLGPSCAMAPGALLVGTHENVKEAVLRLKGKLKTPSLAQNALFVQTRMEVAAKPGLFAYSDPAHLMPLLDKMPLARDEKEMLTAILKAVNPAAIRAASLSVSLEQGRLSHRKLVLLDPKEKSQVLDLLPTRPLDLELLNFAPKDAVFAAAIDNGGGEKRFQDFVALVDSVAPKGLGFGDHVMQIEKALGVSLGKDVMGQISSVGYAMGDPMQVKIKITERTGDNFHSVSSSAEIPPMVIIVQTTGEKAAETLMALMPKILPNGGPAPVKSVIEGREVFVINVGGKDEGDNVAFCYGQQGSTVVIGLHAAAVAKSLDAGAKKQGLLANPSAASRIKEVKGRQAVVFMKPAALTAGLAVIGVGSTSKMAETHKTAGADSKPKFEDKDKAPEKKEPRKPEVKVTYKLFTDDPSMKQLSEVVKNEDYLVIGLLHTKDKLQIDGTVVGLPPLVSKLTDLAVEAMYREQAQQSQRFEEMRKKDREKQGEKGSGPSPK